jgi:hypothetical protein
MHEKRKHPRFDLADEGWRATLTDQVTGNRLGEVVNLSLGGMMILGAAVLEAEHLYQVDLTAMGPGGERESFAAGVLALWSSPAGRPGSSWTGFEIIDISPADRERLAALTGSFTPQHG